MTSHFMSLLLPLPSRCSKGVRPLSSCNIWALLYGLCNYLDDNGRTCLLHMVSEPKYKCPDVTVGLVIPVQTAVVSCDVPTQKGHMSTCITCITCLHLAHYVLPESNRSRTQLCLQERTKTKTFMAPKTGHLLGEITSSGEFGFVTDKLHYPAPS